MPLYAGRNGVPGGFPGVPPKSSAKDLSNRTSVSLTISITLAPKPKDSSLIVPVGIVTTSCTFRLEVNPVPVITPSVVTETSPIDVQLLESPIARVPSPINLQKPTGGIANLSHSTKCIVAVSCLKRMYNSR